MPDLRARRAGTLAAIVGVAALWQWLTPGAAPLAYDPEAWLTWGRELAAGELDSTVGPAIKPLPILLHGATVPTLGDAGARSLWATIATAGLLGALVLAWGAMRRAGYGSAWGLAAVGAVLATPTVLSGGLTGAAEPLALAGLLAAAQLAGRARPVAAVSVLGAVALLRPEALLLVALVVSVAIGWRPADWLRWRVVGAAAVVSAGVIGTWTGLQLLGGGDLGGGVNAATALRPGQPGTAASPLAAALTASALMLAPAVLAFLAASVGGTTRAERGVPRAAATELVGAWLLAFGAAWIAAVVVMSELGFSGEPRYLAPGTAAASVALLMRAAERCRSRTESGAARGPGRLVPVGAAVGLTALSIGAAASAWPAARTLAAHQAQLSALLTQPQVRGAAATCRRIGVPRFLRPAVAWRLERGLAAIQSPSVVGADCRLVRAGAPTPPGWRRVGAAGVWSWWQAKVAPSRQTDP